MFLKLLRLFSSFLEKNPNIFDIIIFGSITKGKKNPKDIDICIIFKGEVDKNAVKETLKFGKFDVIYFTMEEFFSEDFVPKQEILLGYSVAFKKRLFELFNLRPYYLFKIYRNFERKSDEVRFSRALNEFLKENGKKLDRNVIIVPPEKFYKTKEFLDYWRVKYEIFVFEEPKYAII